MTGKKRMLVAEDDVLIHQMYTDIFEDEFEIIHAYDGAETLLLAGEQKPDIIILDITMPILDGRAVCKMIKGNPGTENIKIVMVTGKDKQSDRLLGFELGADDYVEKPVSLEYLARVVSKLTR